MNMLSIGRQIKVSRARVHTIYNDPEKSALAARLIYVSDAQPGIRRVKKGRGFGYMIGSSPVKDSEQLSRIRKLVIPPAWQNVWICTMENGHLQATGVDLKNRKQYRYHHMWNFLRNHTKFHRLHDFGKALQIMRKKIAGHMQMKGLPPEKVLATVVALMEATCIRVGNNLYERLYGSFGLTTLKDKHVKISGAEISFIFTGKKGIPHRISIRSHRLANIVKQCRDIPGKELFQYIDEQGERRCIDSGMVNDYIREVSGGEFTTKDFRTWAGTVQAIRCFSSIECASAEAERKRQIADVLDDVARHLGNTRNVCRKYYVHPLAISLFESGRLKKYLDEPGGRLKENDELDHIERLLLNILRKERLAA
jgi:DNA topoisomerase I